MPRYRIRAYLNLYLECGTPIGHCEIEEVINVGVDELDVKMQIIQNKCLDSVNREITKHLIKENSK